jgi:hypothetical protein
LRFDHIRSVVRLSKCQTENLILKREQSDRASEDDQQNQYRDDNNRCFCPAGLGRFHDQRLPALRAFRVGWNRNFFASIS